MHQLMAQQAQEQTIGLHFYPWHSGAVAPLLGLIQFGCTSCSRLANLEFGGRVGSNFCAKRSSANKNLELQAAKMVTHFDRKDCFPHTDDTENMQVITYN
jgi:hypothetical protein